MNRFKLNWIVGYIKSTGDFPFSVEDVEEDLGEVLGFFDVFDPLDEGEQGVLKEDLKVLALAEEEAEVIRMLSSGEMAEALGLSQLVSSFEDKLRIR